MSRPETSSGLSLVPPYRYRSSLPLVYSVHCTIIVRGCSRVQLEKPKAYGSWSAYSRSKQANILFVVELRRRFAAENVGIGAFALHPGVINTGLIAGHLWGPLDRFTRNVVMPTFKALLTRLLSLLLLLLLYSCRRSRLPLSRGSVLSFLSETGGIARPLALIFIKLAHTTYSSEYF